MFFIVVGYFVYAAIIKKAISEKYIAAFRAADILAVASSWTMNAVAIYAAIIILIIYVVENAESDTRMFDRTKLKFPSVFLLMSFPIMPILAIIKIITMEQIAVAANVYMGVAMAVYLALMVKVLLASIKKNAISKAFSVSMIITDISLLLVFVYASIEMKLPFMILSILASCCYFGVPMIIAIKNFKHCETCFYIPSEYNQAL